MARLITQDAIIKRALSSYVFCGVAFVAGFRLAIVRNSESCLTKTNAAWYSDVSFGFSNKLPHAIINSRELPEKNLLPLTTLPYVDMAADMA